jgi:hypothetical protein
MPIYQNTSKKEGFTQLPACHGKYSLLPGPSGPGGMQCILGFSPIEMRANKKPGYTFL